MNSVHGLSDHSLVRRLAAAPCLYTDVEARTRLANWLAEIADVPAGQTLAGLCASSSILEGVLSGQTVCSLHLWALVRAAPLRLLTLLEREPKRCLADILAKAKRGIAAMPDETEVMRILRRMKAEAALLLGLADIGGVWPITRVIELQTALADTAIGAAVDYLLVSAQRRGPLNVDPASPGTGSGYIVLAMGKMGARELNYSSDVDLIIFYDAAALSRGTDPAIFYVRLTRSLVRLLQERTADGYVFRVDLRLRPDPASTHIAISPAAALDYYESRGQNWERAALIKARPCAGDLVAGEALLAELSPFIWRKYLDFAAVADVHAMKRQIHAYRGHDAIAVEGHNIKLGRGGIREIEFFVQTQQLIAGGRYPELRGRETVPMLAQLAARGWITTDARDALARQYWFLRRVEHAVQMVADEQTHTLPDDDEGLERIARMLGFADSAAFSQAFRASLQQVERHYAALFETAPELSAGIGNLVFTGDVDDPDTLRTLHGLGFQ